MRSYATQTTIAHVDFKHLYFTGNGIIIFFSDSTLTFFQTRFLYEVRADNGNVGLTDMSEDDLLKGFHD